MSHVTTKTMGRMIRSVDDPALRRLLETMAQNIDTLASHTDDLENPDLPGWRDLVLLNGWQGLTPSDYANPQFYKTLDHIVFIRGVITGGTVTSGTSIAVLPMGYRPLKIEAYPIAESSGGGNSYIGVHPDGNIRIYRTTNNAELTISGFFHAEN